MTLQLWPRTLAPTAPTRDITDSVNQIIKNDVLTTVSFNAKQYGAVFDGSTDDYAALTRAIVACNAAGGGYVDLPDGTAIIGTTLALLSNVVLRGQGDASTTLKAKNSLNAAVIRSNNYASLTGQNKYLIADGVPYNFGMCDLRIDGNKANQSSGNGVEFYGKRIYLQDVLIKDCKGIGWVSEGWFNVNTALDPEQPESHYINVGVQNCDSHGIQYRGPTDAYWHSIFPYLNAGWGVRFETDNSTYSGTSDCVVMHCYANTAGGVYVSTNLSMRFGELITESNFGQGLVIDGNSSQIDSLVAYTNCRTTGTYQIELNGAANQVSNGLVADGGVAKSGIKITGTGNQFKTSQVYGAGSAGTGLLVQGALHQIAAYVSAFTAAGGIGFQSGSGGTNMDSSVVDLTLVNNKTNFVVGATGVRNQIRMSHYANAGQVNQSGAFNTNGTETVSASGFDTDTATSVGYFLSGELRSLADRGGIASATSVTNASDLTANNIGIGTILFKGTTSRNSSGFIKIYIGTTAYYVPVFSAITG